MRSRVQGRPGASREEHTMYICRSIYLVNSQENKRLPFTLGHGPDAVLCPFVAAVSCRPPSLLHRLPQPATSHPHLWFENGLVFFLSINSVPASLALYLLLVVRALQSAPASLATKSQTDRREPAGPRLGERPESWALAREPERAGRAGFACSCLRSDLTALLIHVSFRGHFPHFLS